MSTYFWPYSVVVQQLYLYVCSKNFYFIVYFIVPLLCIPNLLMKRVSISRRDRARERERERDGERDQSDLKRRGR